jgi:DNA-binding NarL/FixJ family response regulator
LPKALTPIVGEVLSLAFAGESDAARDVAAAAIAAKDANGRGIDADDRAALVAAVAFADYIDARFAHALVGAQRATVIARDAHAPARLLAASAHDLAQANEPHITDAATPPSTPADQRDAIDALHPALRWIVVAVRIEAAFANGRMSDAVELIKERDRHEVPESLVWFARLQPVRAALFGGDLGAARAACDAVLARPVADSPHDVRALAHAFLALIAAHQSDNATLDAQVQHVRDLVDIPTRWVDGGAHLVAAFALAAAGRPVEARPLVLSGGGGPDLHLAQVVDRALGYDILVTAAIAEGDLEGAEVWARRARTMYATPAAMLAVEQIDARLALARGDAIAGGERAAAAAQRARSAGRLLEAAAADLDHARAMIAAGLTGAAVGQLTAAAHDAELVGAVALRHRASAELRRLGRRLEPRRGAGAVALSPRELEIAQLAAEGFTSRLIAQSVFLSERTVQAHLRRAMRALGVSSRAGLPAALSASSSSAPMPAAQAPTAALTPRQEQVARRVREGLSNAEIAADLGISVKTVEKHVAMIFDRWGVSSRTGIARLAIS